MSKTLLALLIYTYPHDCGNDHNVTDAALPIVTSHFADIAR